MILSIAAKPGGVCFLLEERGETESGRGDIRRLNYEKSVEGELPCSVPMSLPMSLVDRVSIEESKEAGEAQTRRRGAL